MSTDDSETEEYELWTRRETLKKGGAGAAAMAAYPASHSTDPEGFIASVKDKLSGDPDLVVMHNGEVVTEDPKELDFQGTAIKDVYVPNDYDDVVRITLEGGGGSGSGAFEDTDGDGAAELQDDHADFAGGDARTVGATDVASLTDRSFGRETWTTGSVTVSVPGDYASLQAAVDSIPFIPYHDVTIDVSSGTDLSTEDVIVPQFVSGQGQLSSFEHKVDIVGDATTPSNNPLGSIIVAGAKGGVVTLEGFEFQHDNPTTDDARPVAAYYSDHVRLKDCAFAGGSSGVMSYGSSDLSLYRVDFGAGVITGNAMTTKHGGRIQIQRAASPAIEGNVGGYKYEPVSGLIATVTGSSNLTADSGEVDPNARSGLVLDESSASGFETQFLGKYQFSEVAQNNTLTYAYTNTARTIGSATITKLGLDSAPTTETATFDSANNELVIDTDGRYKLTASATWESATGWSTGDRCSVRLTVNEGLASESQPVDPFHRKSGTGRQTETVTATRNLSDGDTVSVELYQDSGASKDVMPGENRTQLEVVRVG